MHSPLQQFCKSGDFALVRVRTKHEKAPVPVSINKNLSNKKLFLSLVKVL